MSKTEFYSRRHLPGRLSMPETAWYLGFGEHDITVLVSAQLLKPLGKPSPNSTKYFSRPYLDRLLHDHHWYNRATLRLNKFWKEKNSNRNIL